MEAKAKTGIKSVEKLGKNIDKSMWTSEAMEWGRKIWKEKHDDGFKKRKCSDNIELLNESKAKQDAKVTAIHECDACENRVKIKYYIHRMRVCEHIYVCYWWCCR